MAYAYFIFHVLAGIYGVCAAYCTAASCVIRLATKVTVSAGDPPALVFRVAATVAGFILVFHSLASFLVVVIGCRNSGRPQRIVLVSGISATVYDILLFLSLAASSFCAFTGMYLEPKTAIIWPGSVWVGYGPLHQTELATSLSSVIWSKVAILVEYIVLVIK